MSKYLPVRAHGLKTRLLPKNIYDALLVASSIKDIVSTLSATEYGTKIEKREEITPDEFANTIKSVFVDRINLIAGIPTISGIRDFILSFLKRYEIENIMRVLRGIKAGKSVEEIMSNLLNIKYGKIQLNLLIQSRSMDKAIEILNQHGYGISNEAVELYKKYDSLLPIEMDLIKGYYSDILRTLKSLPKNERAAIEKLLRMEADIENIFTAVSPYLYGYSQELVDTLLIPYTLKIPLEVFKKVSGIKNDREIMNLLSPYEEIIKLILSKDELKARIEANRLLYKLLEGQAISHSVGIPYVIYVIKMMEYEWKTLTYITYIVHYRQPVTDVERKFIIF